MAIWRVILGCERYEVSKDGCVRRQADRTGLDGGLSSQGYGKYKLNRDGGRPEDLNVQVLMATAFYGHRPDGATTVYLNGDQTDDRLGNSRYQIIDIAKNTASYEGHFRQNKTPAR